MPSKDIAPDTEPLFDSRSRTWYDFLYENLTYSLIRTSFSGQYEKVCTLPTYGICNMYWKNEKQIGLINRRSFLNKYHDSVWEIRHLAFDTEKQELTQQDIAFQDCTSAFLDQDTIIYADGKITKYDGSDTGRTYLPRYQGFSCFGYGVQANRLNETKIYVCAPNRLHIMDLTDEREVKTLSMPRVTSVAEFGSDYLVATAEGVFLVKESEFL